MLPPFYRRNIGPAGSSEQFEPSIARLSTEWNKSAGGGSFTHPFQLIDASDDLGASLSVRYGTVNDVVPTLSGTPLSASPTLALASTGTYLVYLAVSYDNAGVVSGVVVNVVLAGSLPSYDDNTDYIVVGEVDVADDDGTLIISELRQAVTHSLRHGLCGRTFDGGSILDPGTPYFWGI